MTAKSSLKILGLIYTFFFIVFFSYLIPAFYLGPYALGMVQVLLLFIASITVIKYLKTFLQARTVAGAALLIGYFLTIAGLFYLTFIWAFTMIAF